MKLGWSSLIFASFCYGILHTARATLERCGAVLLPLLLDLSESDAMRSLCRRRRRRRRHFAMLFFSVLHRANSVVSAFQPLQVSPHQCLAIILSKTSILQVGEAREEEEEEGAKFDSDVRPELRILLLLLLLLLFVSSLELKKVSKLWLY